MKHLYIKFIFVLWLCCTMPLVVFAQNNTDELQARLEQIKSSKGETSQEYLDALNEIVQIFGNQEASADQLKIAFDYRLKHTTIIATLKGENSVEYAEDLFRLGNTQRRLGNSNDALSYFIKAIEIFEKQQCWDSEFFELSAYMASLILRQQQQYENAIPFQEKCVKCTHCRYGARDMRHIDTCDLLLRLAGQTKKWDIIKQYSRQALDNIGTLTKENFQYYSYATLGEHTWLWVEKRYNEAIEVYLQYLEKVKRDIGENSMEYMEGLRSLTTDYWLVGNNVEAIAHGEKAITILEKLYNGDTKVMHKLEDYYTICNALSNVYGIISDSRNEFKYRLFLIDILLSQSKNNSDEYNQHLIRLFDLAAEIGEYKYALSIANVVETLIPKYSSSPDEDMYFFLGTLSEIWIKFREFQSASTCFNKRLSLLPKLYNGEDLIYERACNYSTLSQIYKELGDLVNANNAINLAEKDALSCKNQSNLAIQELFAHIYHMKGYITSEYEDALKLYSQSLEIFFQLEQSCKNQIRINSSGNDQLMTADANQIFVQNMLYVIKAHISKVLTNRGLRYHNAGQYQLAHSDFTKATGYIESTMSQNSIEYISCQNNIAICEMSMGRYPDAIKTLDDISSIVIAQYSKDSYYYALCLQNYGLYYQITYDYNKLVAVTLQANEIHRKLYGENSEGFAATSANLGMAYVQLGKYDLAENYLNKAYEFYSKRPDDKLILSKILQNLGNLYCGQGKYVEADKAFNECKLIVAKQSGETSVAMAELMAAYGYQCAMLNIDKSTNSLASALLMLQELNAYHTPIASQCSIYYGLSCLKFNQPPLSIYPEMSIDILKEYYKSNFSFFAEYDRAKIWNMLQMHKHMLFSLKESTSMSSELYDYCLFSKSILLSTSTNFGKAVIQSGNAELIEKYNKLQEMKKPTSANTSQAQPADEIAKLEREIVSQLKSDNKYSQSLNFATSDVASALKKNEVAIEFVDYTNLKTDKTEYIALILRSGWKEPKIVPLFEGDKLESFIKGSPKDMYSNSYAGSQLYELIWKPLSKYVHRGDTAYFSPSGKLYTIAIEALHTPNGQPLNQVYNMVRVSSTREVCINKSSALPKSAVIYGGLEYDIDPSQMEEITRSMNLPSFDKTNFTNDSQTRAGWGYLKGSKTEADYISKLMSNSHIEHKLYSGKMGNEESFKALSGMSPTLMHLATHGFFMANSDAKKHTFTSMLQSIGQPGQSQQQTIDPMQRAGLILAGGNNVWTGTEISKNIEDGVLTAAEISAMNLYGTDIVVLSACETGLGDISEDGVFGLQRAFKQAGVNTLIMSLWKVGDSATELMMKTFYKHLLDGKSKRESFAIAQETVKKHEDFSDPYYWAAFIMLD